MRFKRLKVLVGISIILFILMVANTIAFGLLYEKPVAPIDSKSGTLKLVEIPTPNVSTTEKNTTVVKQPTPTVVAPVAPPVVKTVIPPVVQPRKTRAS